jgi:hypothetical protein
MYNVIMLSVITLNIYITECRYVKCHYAECDYVKCHHGECCYTKCRQEEFCSAECRSAEWRAAPFKTKENLPVNFRKFSPEQSRTFSNKLSTHFRTNFTSLSDAKNCTIAVRQRGATPTSGKHCSLRRQKNKTRNTLNFFSRSEIK